MKLFDAVAMALGALAANWMRSALTMLGMIIGVAAVIATFAIGVGAQSGIDKIMQGLGSNVLMVFPGNANVGGARGPSGNAGRITERDVTALKTEVDAAMVIAPSVAGQVQIVYGNLNWATRAQGVTNDMFVARDWELADGRTFSDQEERRGGKVAILGNTVADQLFVDTDPIGATIRIQRVPFEVIGVMRAKGQTMFGQDQDDVVFTPIVTARARLIGRFRARPDQVDNITMKARSAELIDQMESGARAVLERRVKSEDPADAFSIRNMTQFMEAQTSAARTMSRLLGVVAIIALVVGGIGIMNIMLVSVTERTREIGLRMAVGARRSDIRSQVLIESVVLAAVGGTIGILAGVAASSLVAWVSGWPLIIAPWVVGLAFLFAAVVGVFFGWYPATKAARLDPIDALRYE